MLTLTSINQGGSYFSNGIALNTIEGNVDPALESWKNINAINDVVEFILSDSSSAAKKYTASLPSSRPENTVNLSSAPAAGQSLAERGILTVSAIRNNVAAGGLAVATASDVVLCAETAVINPHYRSVGLYGSEFHTYSFYQRAGAKKAKELLRGMIPMRPDEAKEVGFVDALLPGQTPEAVIQDVKEYVRRLAAERTDAFETVKSAPWTREVKDRKSVV